MFVSRTCRLILRPEKIIFNSRTFATLKGLSAYFFTQNKIFFLFVYSSQQIKALKKPHNRIPQHTKKDSICWLKAYVRLHLLYICQKLPEWKEFCTIVWSMKWDYVCSKKKLFTCAAAKKLFFMQIESIYSTWDFLKDILLLVIANCARKESEIDDFEAQHTQKIFLRGFSRTYSIDQTFFSIFVAYKWILQSQQWA